MRARNTSKIEEKPTNIEVKFNTKEEFPIFELGLHTMFETIGYRRNGGEINEDSTTFKYRLKGSRK